MTARHARIGSAACVPASPGGNRSSFARRGGRIVVPLVSSQDASRYQARTMPPPTYDLDRRDSPASRLMVPVGTLAVAAIVAALVLTPSGCG